ncbi:MAG: response regulator transcription factor [Lachnospiraceae bacterium]|nr:response regulator transcription factor [Lachnospiraceae bacterium]MBQ8318713.1 response regulator transcription factor [Lachnospiraceae bacterium]
MSKILIVEDDNDINGMINVALSKEGYECVSAYSGTEGLLRLEHEDYDLVILDLMLPGIEGNEVLKRTREKKNIPFIVLSAKDELDTKVELLTLGANDYMTKPFEIKELLARVQVQLRMNSVMAAGSVDGVNAGGNGADGSITGNAVKQTLDYKELSLDLNGKSLDVNGNQVSLTAQEYKIMELFLKNPGKVFSKNEIYEYAWDDYYMGEDKTIYVHISNIRQKMKKYTENEYIETVWGLGFKL